MARKVKFPLKMADGFEVRTLDELKEHFDIESIVGYFSDGRLLNWLQTRYYEDEADKVEQLEADDSQLHKKLCAIFGVESAQDVDPEEIARRQERLNRLKQYTDDEKILERVDQVAFDQEDLGDLLDNDATLIYLCNNRFTIPLRVTDKTYVGIGKAIAVIRSDKPVDFDALNITFKRVRFDDDYQKILDVPSLAKAESSDNMETARLKDKYKFVQEETDSWKKIFPNPNEFQFLKTDLDYLFYRLEKYRPSSKSCEKQRAANALVAVSEKLQQAIKKLKVAGILNIITPIYVQLCFQQAIKKLKVARILKAHRMLVDDPAMSGAIDDKIETGNSAPKAVLAAYEEQAEIFEAMEDEYFKGRAVDMRCVGIYIAEEILQKYC